MSASSGGRSEGVVEGDVRADVGDVVGRLTLGASEITLGFDDSGGRGRLGEACGGCEKQEARSRAGFMGPLNFCGEPFARRRRCQ